MPRRQPPSKRRTADPRENGVPGLASEDGAPTRPPTTSPTSPSTAPPGALDDTVAEVVVDEPAEAPLSPGPAAPPDPDRSAFEPWLQQFDGQYDPEAGITRVADKRWTLRRIAPPGSLGQVLLSMVCFLIATTLLILALILKDPQYTYTAPVLTPLGLYLALRLFRKWKGHRALTVRIEETLDGPVDR